MPGNAVSGAGRRKPMARGLAALCLLFIVAACQTTGGTGGHTKRVISASESDLLFVPDPQAELKLTYHRLDSGAGNQTIFNVTGRANGGFPHAWFTYRRLATNWTYTNALDLEAYVGQLNFKNKTIGRSTSTRLPIGLFLVQFFTTAQSECAALGVGAASWERFYGYYCWAPGDTVSDEDAFRIAQALGAKGMGGWKELKARHAEANKDVAERTFPLRMSWANFRDDITGNLTTISGKTRGRLLFTLPGGSDCSGHWIHAKGTYKGPGILPMGVWSALCTNGREGKGGFVSFVPGAGAGAGVDGDGNKIILHYGPEAPVAERMARVDDVIVCIMALDAGAEGAWDRRELARAYVNEVERRGLDAATCVERAKALAESVKTSHGPKPSSRQLIQMKTGALCARALHPDKESHWGEKAEAQGFVSEAKRRGLSAAQCEYAAEAKAKGTDSDENTYIVCLLPDGIHNYISRKSCKTRGGKDAT